MTITSTEIETTPFVRVVTPGWVHDYGTRPNMALFVTVEYQHKRNQMWELSLSGVEGPMSNGNCKGSCGQCRESLYEIFTYGAGWDRGMADRLAAVWDRWHLNGMRAGSPRQEAYLRSGIGGEFPGYPTSHYDWATKVLAEAGLQPDLDMASRLWDGVPEGETAEPYSYGSAWRYEPVPGDVLWWLYNLPPAERAHPWHDTDSRFA